MYTRAYNALSFSCRTRLNIFLPLSFQDLQKHIERTQSAEKNYEELLASLLEEVKPVHDGVLLLFCE